MPTGYTAGVADGTVTDLKTFALTLARGMGALVMMRDEPWDAPIPDRFEPSDYYINRVNEATERYQFLESLSEDEIKVEIEKEKLDYEDRKVANRRKHDETKARYEAMIAKVQEWQGAPEGIKEFALSQLKDSMEFDCREPYRFWGKEPESDPFVWINEQLALAAKEIKRAEEGYTEEVERVNGRNEWIKQLKDSLND